MLNQHKRSFLVLGLSAALVAAGTGCKQLPGSDGTQGAAIGGLGGAAAGAVLGGSKNRVLGAVLGGVIGAGGGYVLGANKDKILNKDRDGAADAQSKAETRPATAQEAMNSASADINSDGFVTMDEVVAMKDAGLADDQMMDRLLKSGQVFDLTSEQKDYLRGKGVSNNVLDGINDVNRETKDRLMTEPSVRDGIGSEPISRPQPSRSTGNTRPLGGTRL